MEFVTFEWRDDDECLSLVRKEMHGYWHLVFQDNADAVPTLWELMPSGDRYLSYPVVRVRGREENSVWHKSPGSDWILSEGAAVEDRYALFAFVEVDDNTFSLLCLGNQRYVKAAKESTYAPNGLIATEETNASELCKFRVNKELPKYTSFQWNNDGQYLTLRRKEMHGYWHLEFANTNDVTEWEVVPTYQQHESAYIVRVRLPQYDASIWVRSPASNFVLASGAVEENLNSQFAWVKVSDNTVSLLCLGNNRYVKVDTETPYAPNTLRATETDANNLCKFVVNGSNLCESVVKDALP